MNKLKIIIFISILLFSIYKIIDNKNLDIQDNVYIVSSKEVEERKDISNSVDNEEPNEVKGSLSTENMNKKTITIFISGEVKNPGVVTIDAEKRLSDAIDELGGTTEDADLNKINLAIKLEDESHYIIPKIGDDLENYNNASIETNVSNNLNSKSNLININTANIQELDTLPGIGEATANKIVNHREKNGKFNSIEEIKNVNGIGDKKYEELKDLISIEWYRIIKNYSNKL